MELCVDFEQCNHENVSNATKNYDGVTTHLGNPNITELDGNTAVTESNGEIPQGKTNADEAATKQGNQAETDSLQFSIALFSTIILILTSIFAI